MGEFEEVVEIVGRVKEVLYVFFSCVLHILKPSSLNRTWAIILFLCGEFLIKSVTMWICDS